MDWTANSSDPNDAMAKRQMVSHLRTLQRPHVDRDLMDVVMDAARGRRVLEIGVVSHTRRYIDSSQWRHRMLCDVSAYILGLDILEPLVKELQDEGFNVICAVATSDADLNQRFDMVCNGEVIEHVDR